MRLRMVKDDTHFDFFSRWKMWVGFSLTLIVLGFVSLGVQGLNFGIDFRGGTTIRTESSVPVDVAAYRAQLQSLKLGDVSVNEVFDPSFGPGKNVAMIRIEAQSGQESLSAEDVQRVEEVLKTIDPGMKFPSVESVGPKVSGELIQTAILAVVLAIGAVLIYIWLRFEWQFALGAVAALIHDVLLTIGVFSVIQMKFDLSTIAALLTIVGYSLNDTVVVFDRVRENLRKYKKKDLQEVLNLSINETLSRTIMTSFTTLLALFALFALGGDVIRGFVFAMIWGIIVGTYSSIFIASTLLLYMGVKRDWSKQDANAGNNFAKSDP